MKKLLVCGCMLGMLFLSGCNSASSPKAVLAKFLTAMEHGDIQEAKKYASADSQSFLNMVGENNNGTVDVYKNEDFVVTDNIRINGNDAKVEVRGKSSDTGIDFSLRKEDGGWKVVFNLGALFNTAIEGFKKAGQDVKKEINNALDSIKTSLDSLP